VKNAVFQGPCHDLPIQPGVYAGGGMEEGMGGCRQCGMSGAGLLLGCLLDQSPNFDVWVEVGCVLT